MTKLTKIAAMVLVALTLTMGVEANAAELPSVTVVEPSDYVPVITKVVHKEKADCRVIVEKMVVVDDFTVVDLEPECTFVQFLFNGIVKIFQGKIGFGEFINDVRSW